MASDANRKHLVPGPDHPITVTPTGRVVATVGDTLLD